MTKTTTTTTITTTTTKTTTPTGACSSVTFQVTNSWAQNFQATMTVTGYSAPTIVFSWSAATRLVQVFSGASCTVSADSLTWTCTLTAGSTSFNFQAGVDVSTTYPGGYIINGNACGPALQVTSAPPLPCSSLTWNYVPYSGGYGMDFTLSTAAAITTGQTVTFTFSTATNIGSVYNLATYSTGTVTTFTAKLNAYASTFGIGGTGTMGAISQIAFGGVACV
eukprot:m.224482 g.224482  ORF g.224482 m.224482 type:complete len:222 (-) comp11096_c0_seq1:131-796(-)